MELCSLGYSEAQNTLYGGNLERALATKDASNVKETESGNVHMHR